MRPVEMKVFCRAFRGFVLSSFSGRLRGKEDSDRKSLIGKSKVWTFPSPRPMPLITALLPRRPTLMRYWSADCEWA